MTPWYAIFDWDGVVVDSMRAHERSWELLEQETDFILPPDHFKRSFGMRNEIIIPDLLGWTSDPGEIRRLSLRKEELFRACIERDGLRVIPGAVAWIHTLHRESIPRVIASSTQRKNIQCALDALDLNEYFAGMVTAEDVARGKPDPDVFLQAADRVKAPPERCVVFEDAHVGIEAALRAGMRVVAIDSTHPRESLIGAHVVISSFDEMRLETISDWFQPPVA